MDWERFFRDHVGGVFLSLTLAWYLAVAVVLYFFSPSSERISVVEALFWLFFVFDLSVGPILYLVSYLWGLAVGGIAVYYGYELYEKRLGERLDRIVEEKRELESLQKEAKGLEKKVDSLSYRKDSLEKEVSKYERAVAQLKDELRKLASKKNEIEERIARAEREGYERGYQRVIGELRSHRRQKSALLDVFDKSSELQYLWERETGMDIRTFLKRSGKEWRG